MTEKRFEMKDPNCWGYPITDNKTGTVYSCNSNIWMKELVGVLNALNEENTQLKSSNMELEDYLARLEEENQRLLSANTKLTNENTAILNTIRTTYQNERTSLGRNTLKQLIEALE